MGVPDEVRARANARIGTVLNDKWTLERLIGLGGMAAVYAARHRNGARGAVKLLHAEVARVQEVRERFTREGYAANQVNHPGSVRVLDDDVVSAGPDAGSAYLIMDLLEGSNLEDRIHDGGPFSHDEILAIADDVLDVLAAAHAQGVIHRDLKPENLMLEAGDGPFGFRRVKVLDFGLARIAHGEVVTRAGMALGTPSYMAPEQAEGRSEAIGPRSDVFAVGAILFRLLTGRRVHEGANVIEVVAKMAREPAPRVRSVRPDAPVDLAAIIDRALEFDPDDRYPGAAEMRAAVQAAREARKAVSLGNEPTQIAATPLAALSPQPTLPEPAREPRRRVGVLLSVVWVASVAMAAIVVFALMRRGRVEEALPSAPAASESASAAASASELPEALEDAAPPDAAHEVAVEDLEALGDAGVKPAPKPIVTAKPKTTTTAPKKPPAPTVHTSKKKK